MARRILVVEDSDDARRLLVDALSSHGYEVLEAGSGEEAIDRVLSERPDLVVLDMSLPAKSGWEVAAEVSQGPAGDIPIIALSGYTSETDRQKALEAGCVIYLEKPCRPRDLISQIERILESLGSMASG
jgi:CheY-like chemotaxis protein